MTKLQGSWIWYELMTPDPDGARAFYEPVVGWSMTTSHGENADYGFITCADGGMVGGMLRLSADMAQHGARPCWLGYIGVDNVDASLEAIAAKGGRMLMPARDVAMAGRIAMVADGDGAPFYIMTPTPPPGGGESTAFSSQAPGRCSWNELLAGNQANALSFYRGLFGWTQDREPMDMGGMGTYDFIAHDGTEVGAIMQKPPQAPGPMWHHYFRVASIDAAQAAAIAHGGTVLNGPMEVPGGDWIIQGIDPQGAMFCLVGAR